jgi:tetratricopeptide (TPR) repeat protein
MLKVMFKNLIAAGLLLFVFSIVAYSQGDLGSSTGVFRPKNPTTKKSSSTTKKTTTTKKPVVKETTVSSTKKPKVKNTTTTRTTTSTKRPTVVLNKEELFEDAIEDGNAARDARNYVAAERAYKRARTLLPKDARAVYGLGNLYVDQQRWEMAEKYYREAIKLDANDVDAYIALSFVLVQPYTTGNLATKYADAERFARRAVQLDAQNPVAYDRLGVALELRGIIDKETEDAYRKAIELDPEYAVAHAHLARLLRKNGLNEEANASYRNAIKYANDVPTMILVAESLQSQQRFGDSEQLLRRALDSDPKNPTALFLLGRALSVLQKYPEAETVLLQSIQISPKSFTPYSILGSVYLRTERYEDAEKTFLKALPLASANEKKQLAGLFGFMGVGDGYMKAKRPKDALRAYRKALELDSNSKEVIAKIEAAKTEN